MRSITRTACLLVVLILYATAAPAQNPEKISLQFKWKNSFQFAGYIAAKEKGFYAEEGLEVEFRERRFGKTSYFDAVVNGEADFGTADIGILQRYLTGDQVVWLAQIFQHSPQIFMTIQGTGITSPYEMAGKRVALDLDNPGNAPLTMMLRETIGNPAEKLKIQPISYDYDRLARGEVDVMPGYITDQPFRFKEQGIDVNIISPRNYGFDFYGDNLFTTLDQVVNHPERVAKMIRASLRGWEYALAHQEEIIELILAKYNTQGLSRERLRYEAKMTDRLIMSELIPLGSIDPKRIRRILHTYRHLGLTEDDEVPEGLLYQGDRPTIELTPEEQVWLERNRNLVFPLRPGLKPAFFLNEDGQPSGFIVDIYKHLERAIGRGVRITLKLTPDAHAAAQEDWAFGHAGILDYDTPRNRGLYTLTKPYLYTPFIVFTQARDRSLINQLSDLQGKSVAIHDQDRAIREFVDDIEGVNIVKVDDPRTQLEMLQYGQVDAVIGYFNYHQLITENMFGKVVPAFSTKGKIGACIGVKPEYPLLVSILDKAIATLSEEERNQIVARWVGKPPPRRAVKIAFSPEEKSWLAEKHTIRARVSSWPPFMIKSGELTGASVDYLKAVAEYVGLDVRFEPDTLGWVDAMKDVRTDRRYYDLLLAMTRSPARMKNFAFTKPYLATPQVVIGRRDQTGFAQMADLEGKTVAIEKGFVIKGEIEAMYPKIMFLEVENTLAALKAVATNQAEAYIGILAVATNLIRSQGLTNLKVVAATPFRDRELCMSMRSDWAPLASIIDKALRAIPADKLLKIRNKWLGEGSVGESPKGPSITLTPLEKSYLAQKNSIKMCVDPNWMPFERITKEGRYEGIIADYVDLLSKKLGVRFQLIPTKNYPESMAFFSQNRCDIIPGEVNRPNLPETVLPTKPYYFAPRVFAVQADSAVVADFNEIAGGRIGVLAESPALKLLPRIYPGVKLIPIESTAKGLRLVESKELDAFVSPLATISHSIRVQGLSGVKIGGAIAKDIPFSALVNKNDRLLVGILNKAIDSITLDERRAINDKWILVTYEQGVDYVLIAQVSAVLVIIILLLFWRSRVIQKANRALVEAQGQLKEKNIELERLSLTDTLTGLFNRRALEPLVDQEMGRRKRFGHPVSLMILDIDHFKRVNDTYGHITGDEVLAGLSAAVVGVLRKTDTMARWGGEEFAILAAETDLPNAVLLADKVRRHVEEMEFEKVGGVTISIGVAEYRTEESYLDWYHRADDALYRAKEAGRNRVEADRPDHRDQEQLAPKEHFLQLVWQEDLRCGEKTIDRQYRELFEQANEVINTFFLSPGPDRTNLRLDRFRTAMADHFHYEEKLLARYSFGNLEAHRKEHRELLVKAGDLINDYNEGSVEAGEMITFLTQDLVARHLYVWDREFYPVLRG